MFSKRIIPVLELHDGYLAKTTCFGRHTYVGDPFVTLRIFNDLEVDELIVLDVSRARSIQPIDPSFLQDLSSECFMPLSYGGGISTIDDFSIIFQAGFEKCVVNSILFSNPSLVEHAADRFGSQSIVASIDYKPKPFSNELRSYHSSGRIRTRSTPLQSAIHAEKLGCGEVLLHSIARDGTFKGYDLPTLKDVSQQLNIPVVPLGGASSLDDLQLAFQQGASAAAAASLFTFKGPHKAVLINMPDKSLLQDIVTS